MVSDYGLAIEAADEASSYFNSRGTCYHELGEFELARKDYDEAIACNAKCVSAYNNRASNNSCASFVYNSTSAATRDSCNSPNRSSSSVFPDYFGGFRSFPS